MCFSLDPNRFPLRSLLYLEHRKHISHIQFLPRPTELATRLGQLRWPSYEAAPGGVECLVSSVWKGAVAPRRRLLPMHMKVSFVGYMHFPTCQQIATMAKGNCNMQHRRRSPIRVSNDVAQWGK